MFKARVLAALALDGNHKFYVLFNAVKVFRIGGSVQYTLIDVICHDDACE